MPRHAKWTLVFLVPLLTVLASPTNAFAIQGQGYLGVGAANTHQLAPTASGFWGPSLHLGGLWNTGDFLRLTLDVQGSHHRGRLDEDAEDTTIHNVLAIAAGARYDFDIITYVPFAGLSLVTYPLGLPRSETRFERFGLRASIGLDYRHTRKLGFGAAIELSTPLVDPGAFPLYTSARVHLSYHFRL